jgi:hypothetical protein
VDNAPKLLHVERLRRKNQNPSHEGKTKPYKTKKTRKKATKREQRGGSAAAEQTGKAKGPVRQETGRTGP